VPVDGIQPVPIDTEVKPLPAPAAAEDQPAATPAPRNAFDPLPPVRIAGIRVTQPASAPASMPTSGPTTKAALPADEIDKLVAQLDADKFEDREAAQKKLVAAGPTIVPALKEKLASGKLPLEAKGRVEIILGKILQVFHDTPRVAGSHLVNTLAGSPLELFVRLESLTLDQITRVWEALDRPYQLCTSYEVSVLPIDYKTPGKSSDNASQGSGSIAKVKDSDIVIQTKDITDQPSFYPASINGTDLEVIAVKASDGTIRTAFNTCQVCYNSGKGYYKVEGDQLVCQNCGNRFGMDDVEVTKGGCNPVPITDEYKKADDKTITVTKDVLVQATTIFKNWK
jgi:hypothetical protein